MAIFFGGARRSLQWWGKTLVKEAREAEDLGDCGVVALTLLSTVVWLRLIVLLRLTLHVANWPWVFRALYPLWKLRMLRFGGGLIDIVWGDLAWT